MGTTAQKLTYLNETKSQLKDTINYTGASITDDTFRQYPRKLYTQYLDILKEPDTLFNNMPKVPEQTGTELTINDTADTRMKLKLNPSELTQETTTGKNLFDIKGWLTSHDVKYIENSDGSLTFNATNILYSTPFVFSNTDINVSISGIITNETATNVRLQLLNSEDRIVGEVTSSSTTSLNKGACKVRLNYNTSGTCTIKNAMIESGAEATSYESYTGGTPQPNPDYPSEVQVIKGNNSIKIENKNLFNNTYTTFTQSGVTFTINEDGTITANGTVTANYIEKNILLNTIPIYADKYYVMSLNAISGSVTGTFAVNSRLVANGTSSWAWLSNTSSAKKSSTDGYLNTIILYATKGVVFDNFTFGIKIEQNSSATSYVAHQEQVLPLNLPVENLLNNTLTSQTLNGVQFSVNEDKSIYVKGTATARTEPRLWTNASGALTLKANTTYYNNSNTILYLYADAYISIPEGGNYTPTEDKSISYIYIRVENGETIDKTIYLMLSTTKSSTYTPYGTTPIEYCKIGDYEDEFEHDGNKWYLNKYISKVVLDSTNVAEYIENLDTTTYSIPAIRLLKSKLGFKTSWDTHIALSNKYSEITTTSAVRDGVFTLNFQQAYLNIFDSRATDIATAKNILVGTEIYIALATPTHEEITDSTLINQLNAIEKALSYDGQTNISQTNTGLPFRIKASAVRSLANIFDLTNE